MTHMQRQRSCTLSDCTIRIDSNGGNVHVASASLLYIISYYINSYYIIS
jgi:hypothetical protein